MPHSLDLQKKRKKFGRKLQADESYDHLGVFWSWGWRTALEWGAAVGVGAFLGSLIDRLGYTGDWGLVGGLLLGSATGLWNIYKSCQNYFCVHRR